jgi:hypothetical protein
LVHQCVDMTKRYSAVYDAYYDDESLLWLEEVCGDNRCSYCSERPERPEKSDLDDVVTCEVPK